MSELPFSKAGRLDYNVPNVITSELATLLNSRSSCLRDLLNYLPCHQIAPRKTENLSNKTVESCLLFRPFKSKKFPLFVKQHAGLMSRTLHFECVATEPRIEPRRANNHKLTILEEKSLQQWILSVDQCGARPRPAMVQEMANILLAKRSHQTIGKNWVHNFIKRHDDLKTRFSQSYNYKRAKFKDPKVIHGWFDCVRHTIQERGILEDDIYNFDETGFAMGLIATAKVVTRAGYYGRRPLLQPGNREWVTSIEAINATGFAIPPCLIFKAKVHQQAWYEDMALARLAH